MDLSDVSLARLLQREFDARSVQHRTESDRSPHLHPEALWHMGRVRGGSLTGSIKGRECIDPLHLGHHLPAVPSATEGSAAAFKAKVMIERMPGANSRVELHLEPQMAPSLSTDCNAVFL